ncbi:hypothetical protein [Mycolicibacterium farcinogenes]|uniref:Uncharacterized protein n=1 Tax=Mycolicibacterium farcinogenes TaxID=1802 RepID=A0ACD1FMP5_MYCFR|nr:hypothetical protein [Mycolicibacterium farcinogenes]QZH68322.1 hypothetical protein K6L26_12250 [Mycolicibacterium farcinogenes]
MANDPAAIAAKLAKLYETEPVQEPTEPDTEPVGKGNIIPSAGNQPDHVPTEKELIGLAEQAGDTEQSTRLKNEQLQKLIAKTYGMNP